VEAWLTAIRFVHFAAVIVAFGQFAYAAVVSPEGRLPPRFGAVVGWSLALAVVTGLAWLAIEAGNMSGLPVLDALHADTVPIVLGQTQFGHVWCARAVFAALVAASLAVLRFGGPGWSRAARAVGAGAALLLLAALAGAGHAAADSGVDRLAHLGADAAHLVAAGAWLGTLLPFAALLRSCAASGTAESLAIASSASLRFSALGQACVGVLVLTGLVNACYMIPSVAALFGSRYGADLLVKLGLVAVMVLVAAFNRASLVPKIASAQRTAGTRAASALARNAAIEMALGIAIVAVVAQLGITMPPMAVH
jgi:putative copper resistance protein D